MILRRLLVLLLMPVLIAAMLAWSLPGMVLAGSVWLVLGCRMAILWTWPMVVMYELREWSEGRRR